MTFTTKEIESALSAVQQIDAEDILEDPEHFLFILADLSSAVENLYDEVDSYWRKVQRENP